MPSYPVPAYLDLLGIPFERGARGPDKFDCYGLLMELHRRNGIEILDFHSPGTLEEIEEIMGEEARRWKPVPIGTIGATITFRVDGAGAHVGFMLPADRFIHCLDGEGVTTERLTNSMRMRPIGSYVYA